MAVTYINRAKFYSTNWLVYNGAAVPGFVSPYSIGNQYYNGATFDILVEQAGAWELWAAKNYTSNLFTNGTLYGGTLISSGNGTVDHAQTFTCSIVQLTQRIIPFTITGAATDQYLYFNGTDWVNHTITELLTLTGGISTADYVTFDTVNAQTPGTGKLSWDLDNYSLKVGTGVTGTVEQKLGVDTLILVYNSTASTLSKGQVVYINGAQGNTVSVALADADLESTSSVTIGMVAESIPAGSQGLVQTGGLITKMNTVGLTEGAALWLSSTPGEYSTTKPTAPANGVLIGFVARAHAVNGSIYLYIQNGYELDELHNVLITSAANSDILRYDGSLWKNSTQSRLLVTSSSTLDWSNAEVIRYTLTANSTLTNSGSIPDGKKLVLELLQDSVGARTVSFTSETRFGTDITSVTLSTAPNTIDRVALIYNLAANKWDVLAVVRGF